MALTGRAKFEDLYQTNPIVLTGGIAANQPGGVISILDLLVDGFASFKPVTGASLLKNQCATYPFANQAVAGNALIADPLTLQMQMICPASSAPDGVGYLSKQSIMTALVASLNQHNAQGGLYTVFTPSFVYNDGVLLDLRDVTSDDMKQKQVIYQWDLYFPLLTLAAAAAAQGSLYQKLDSGATIVGQPSFSTGATNPSSMQQPQSVLTPPTIQ